MQSRAVAEALRDWLPLVLNIRQPWMSTEDIDPGERWETQISNELKSTSLGIIVISKSNTEAPWLLFEAGALAHKLGTRKFVIPYLVGIDPLQLAQNPLMAFQAVSADRGGTLKLVKALNSALEEPITDDHLLKRFDGLWPGMENALRNLPRDPSTTIKGRRKVVFVINSGERFNQELQYGFVRETEKLPIELLEGDFSHTDAASFILALNRAELKNPDYIITVPPNKDLPNSPDATRILKRLTDRGTRTIFIENAPDALHDYHGNVTVIQSDSKAGAQVLAQYARSIVSNKGTILLLNGPQDSENARERRDIFLQSLQLTPGNQSFNVISMNLTGWSQSETEQYVTKHLIENGNSDIPEVIICGNDSMALGAVTAVRHHTPADLPKPKILGYDGLMRAVMAIADESNPFCATIAIPPSSYGKYAAQAILQEMRGGVSTNREELTKLIPIHFENLITTEKANRFLDKQPWGL